jgi:hypothetical protein
LNLAQATSDVANDLAILIDDIAGLVHVILRHRRSSTVRLLGPQRPLVPYNPVSIICNQLETVVTSEHLLLVGHMLGREDRWLLNRNVTIDGNTVNWPVAAVFLNGTGARTVGHIRDIECIPGAGRVCWVPDVVATSCDNCQPPCSPRETLR